MTPKLTGEGVGAVKKKSECQTKAGNQECFEKLSLSLLSQLSLSHSLSLDMLNNFCFHVYAQKSLFKVENVNAYFLTSSSSAASAPREFANHRAGSQLKFFTTSPTSTALDTRTYRAAGQPKMSNEY